MVLASVAFSIVIASALAVSASEKPKQAGSPMKPGVELLRETWAGEDDGVSLEHMLVPLGAKVRIAYVCHGETDLATARLLYRILGAVVKEKDAHKEPWIELALAQVRPDDKTGPFNPKTGVFANAKFDQEVPFFAISSPDRQGKHVRMLGGGRVLLDTKRLVDAKGNLVQLKAGDRIEYCVEVTERSRKSAPTGVMRSATRVTSVVTLPEFHEWYRRATDEEDRIRKLKLRQKDLFKEK
jgi:hypothetical protein